MMITELATLKARLASRERDLTHLLHVLNHDLRAPLRAVVAFSSLLQEEDSAQEGGPSSSANDTGVYVLDAERLGYLQHVLAAAREMQELLADLDTYGRISRRPSRAQRVDADLALERARSGLRLELEATEALLEVGPLPPVLADPDQVGMVWHHLLRNALTFRAGKPHICISGERLGVEVLFRIRDDGIGISPADAERVFDLFVRLHARDAYPGHGAGLSFVRKIVEHHGGRTWVEASPADHGGTCVCFTLAAAPG
jgi:signal transduction histidine kinase